MLLWLVACLVNYVCRLFMEKQIFGPQDFRFCIFVILLFCLIFVGEHAAPTYMCASGHCKNSFLGEFFFFFFFAVVYQTLSRSNKKV